MVKIVWTHNAYKDLNDIGNYIEEVSFPSRASKVLDTLIDSTSILQQFPLLGRMVPEYQHPDIREIIRINFRIVYRIVNSSRIDILSVQYSAKGSIELDFEL